jgi:hypothetical protein
MKYLLWGAIKYQPSLSRTFAAEQFGAVFVAKHLSACPKHWATWITQAGGVLRIVFF